MRRNRSIPGVVLVVLSVAGLLVGPGVDVARAADGVTLEYFPSASDAVDPCEDDYQAPCEATDWLAEHMQAAVDHWRSIIRDEMDLEIRYWWVADEAPSANVREVDEQGRPTEADVRIPADANYFYDPTPDDDEEFDMSSKLYRTTHPSEQDEAFAGAVPEVFEVGYNGRRATAQVNGRDLLTVILHELGHVFGLTDDVTEVTGTCDPDASPYYEIDTGLVGGAEVALKAFEGSTLDWFADEQGEATGEIDCAHLALGGIQPCASQGLSGTEEDDCKSHQALMWTGLLSDSMSQDGEDVAIFHRARPSVADALAVATAAGYTDVHLPRRFAVTSGAWHEPGTWIGARPPDATSDAVVVAASPPVEVTVAADGEARDVRVGDGSRLEVTSSSVTVRHAVLAADGSIALDASHLLGTSVTNGGIVRGSGSVAVSDRFDNDGGRLLAEDGTLSVFTSQPGGVIDLDGSFSSPAVSVSAVDGHLVVDGPLTDPVDTQVVVGPGRSMTFTAPWTLGFAGTLTLHGSAAGATVHGQGLVQGTVDVLGVGRFASPMTFAGSATVLVDGPFDRLRLSGATTYQGGTYTGEGRIDQHGDAFVASDTTIGPVGTYDWDGYGASATVLEVATSLTVDAERIEPGAGSDGFDGEIDVRAAAELTVRTPAGWRLEGTLRFNPTGGAASRLDGSPVTNDGVIDVTNSATIAAPTTTGAGGTVELGPWAMLMLDVPAVDGKWLGVPQPHRLAGGSIVGDGTVVVRPSARLRGHGTIGSDVDVDGSLFAEGGTLHVLGDVVDLGLVGTAGTDAVLDVSGVWTTHDGRLALDGGRVTGANVLNTGTTSGRGNLAVAAFSNGGRVAPGPSVGTVGAGTGILAFDERFAQTAKGWVDVGLGGTTPGAGHDQLAVRQGVRLAGRLHVHLLEGYQPVAGDTFDVITYAARIGTFDAVTLPDLGPGLDMHVVYGPGAVRLVVSAA